MRESEHWHDAEDEKELCPNCQLAKIEAEMSEFEKKILNWFISFGRPFCLESGITASEWLRLNFQSEIDAQIAAQILETLYWASQKIISDKIKDNQNG